MDFSSNERALLSLQGRTPKLPPIVQSHAAKLLAIVGRDIMKLEKDLSVSTMIADPLFVESTSALLNIGTHGIDVDPQDNHRSSSSSSSPRWEALAVAFHLTAAYLQELTALHSPPSGHTEVYMDGPRVPTIIKEMDEEEMITAAGTENIKEEVVTFPSSSASAAAAISDDQLISFCTLVIQLCHTHLEHKEPRVRSLVAKVVGQHAKLSKTLKTKVGVETNSSDVEVGNILVKQSITLYKSILNSLYDHLNSGREDDGKDSDNDNDKSNIIPSSSEMKTNEDQKEDTDTNTDTVEGGENKFKYSKSSDGALDDTTGWRALETNLFGIGSFIQANGGHYFEYSNSSEAEEGELDVPVDEQLLKSVEYCCITHINRHVRAAGINVLEQMIHSCYDSPHVQDQSGKSSSSNAMGLLYHPQSHLRKTIVTVLRTTLSDNWSQVRMAASVLCRVFYVTMLDYAEQYPESLETCTSLGADLADRDVWLTSTYPILLPQMCLNRFYLAQGVKLYSHDTWRILFDRNRDPTLPSKPSGDGLESVAMHAGAVCRYYVKMCDADNHVVREAACQAVAELANKIGRNEDYAEYLTPYVVTLLQALLMCFHDESWPVRDEACLACGIFCLAYPEECEPELPTLFCRWSEQITDQIWSVREDAAFALGDAIEAYGQTLLEKAMQILKKDLSSAKSEPAMSREEYKRRQNDIDSHTNSQLYSCGSLAPKLRKGGAGRIGCSSCDVTRPKAPWEATDGCIYLIRELIERFSNPNTSGIVLSDDVILPLITELAETCRVRHFPQSDDLRTTLWKNLPVMARALGKQRFKRIYLQTFMDMMVDNLDEKNHASQLSVHAAGQCAEELSNLVGPGIFRGRLEEDWQREILDNAMKERRQQMSMRQMTPSEGFSPFGPAEASLAAVNGRPKSRTYKSKSSPSNSHPSVDCTSTDGSLQLQVPGSGMIDSL